MIRSGPTHSLTHSLIHSPPKTEYLIIESLFRFSLFLTRFIPELRTRCSAMYVCVLRLLLFTYYYYMRRKRGRICRWCIFIATRFFFLKGKCFYYACVGEKRVFSQRRRSTAKTLVVKGGKKDFFLSAFGFVIISFASQPMMATHLCLLRCNINAPRNGPQKAMHSTVQSCIQYI